MTHRDLQPEQPHETSINKLIEAREQMDAGLRLGFPAMFAEQASAPVEDQPPVNSELAEAVLERLSDARAVLLEAMKLVDQMGDPLAHYSVGELVNSVDDRRKTLAERWGS